MTVAPRARSIVLAVAGGSGSGKSTVVGEVVHRLGPERTAVLHHDAYYRDLGSLSPAERELVNFDHPDSLETDLLVEHLDRLLRGEEVTVPVYDFATHTRRPGPGIPLVPRPVLILDGVLVLADPRLRERADVRVFVDTDPEVRLVRRIRRDSIERGRTIASVLEQYERSVRPMHLELVEPSKRYADLLVGEGGQNRAAIEAIVASVEALLAVGARGELGAS
jgi:uridine kinase